MEILIAPLTVSKTFKEQELMKESHSRWRKLAVFQLLHYHIVFVCCCFAFAWLCSDIVQNIQCDCVLALCGCVLFSLGICALKKAHMTCGSFQMLPLKQFWCLPDWEWLFFFFKGRLSASFFYASVSRWSMVQCPCLFVLILCHHFLGHWMSVFCHQVIVFWQFVTVYCHCVLMQ